MLAASGHTMTAAWHVGPIEGREFWWLLVSSPEILVFLFFMITDPKTIPAGRAGRRALRRRGRPTRDGADRSADDRVRDEGRDPRRARARVCDTRRDRARRRSSTLGVDEAAPRAGSPSRRPAEARHRRVGRARRCARLRRRCRRRRDTRAAGGLPDRGTRRRRCASRGHGRRSGRRRHDRPGHGPEHRA